MTASTTPRKGLRASIYKSARGDSSNGGISSRCDQVTLVGPEFPEIFPVTDEAPAVEVVHNGFGLIARPVEGPGPDEATTPWMFGGCFVSTEDSRFSAVSRSPIALHDRTESWSLNEALSR